MRVIRWKNAATGVESLNITATGVYFPVGKEDAAFIARYVMASAGQTASVEVVRDSNGSRVGVPGVSVSGTTETISRYKRSLAFGIIVTAISGTLTATLDDQIVRTIWPDNLGRFPAQADLDAYTYMGTGLDGCTAMVAGVQVVWNGTGWDAVVKDARFYRPIRLMGLGDSIDIFGGGITMHAAFQSGGAFQWLGRGVVGDTAADVIARFAADVTPYAPDIVCVKVGTNEILQSIPIATYKDNLRTIVGLIRGISAIPVFIGIPPNGSSVATQAAYARAQYEVARELSVPFSPCWRTLNDGKFNMKAGYSSDYTHPYIQYLKAEGATLLQTLKDFGFYTPMQAEVFSNTLGGGIGTNAFFLTDTNADGKADNISTTYGTGTFSLVSGEIGNAQRMAFTSAANPTGFEVALGSVTAGKKYMMMCRVILNCTSGELQLNSFNNVGPTKDATFGGGSQAGHGYVVAGETYSGWIVDEFIARVSSTCKRTFININAGCNGYIQVEQCQLFDLTAAGLA